MERERVPGGGGGKLRTIVPWTVHKVATRKERWCGASVVGRTWRASAAGSQVGARGLSIRGCNGGFVARRHATACRKGVGGCQP